jgi:pimeloyl-ACP methyl ester carboxylesterase
LDILAVVDAFDLGRDIIAAGHSAGAAHILCAELERVGTFSRAVLIDPIVMPSRFFAGGNPLIEAARRRRTIFENREAARARFSSKPPMSLWETEALEAYVAHGLREREDGQVELRCSGESEACCYERAADLRVYDRLGEITMEATFVTGSESYMHGIVEAQSGLLRGSELVVVDGASHFVPQERPAEVADLILSRLS